MTGNLSTITKYKMLENKKVILAQELSASETGISEFCLNFLSFKNIHHIFKEEATYDIK